MRDDTRCPNLKHNFARRLRAHATEAERRLWALLRGKQIAGLRFRRQQPIGPYIADFFCPAAKLIVELDGDQHGAESGLKRDAACTAWLTGRNYHVLRFSNHEFLKNPQRVLAHISGIVAARAALPGSPEAILPSLKGRVG